MTAAGGAAAARHFPLSSTEVSRYRRDGFLAVHRPLFPEPMFARLAAIFETLLDRYGPDDLDVPHFRNPRLFDFLLADEVLDLVEPILGPDIGLWSSHFISKPPRTGFATPWHEDKAYWQGRVSRMDQIVTVWLAIDKTDPENGAMGVLPGSHRHDERRYESVPCVGQVFDRQIEEQTLDLRCAIHLSLEPNEYSLHDARLVHGADANRSDRRRAGFTMRYFATTTRVIAEANPDHKVWLARGCDRAGTCFAPPP